MKTIPFNRVFNECLRAVGLDTEVALVSNRQNNHFVDLINYWVSMGWEAEWWPEVMLVEQRQYRDTYAAGTTYAEDDEVWYVSGDDSGYFVSLSDGNVGNTPSFAADTAFWATVDTSDFMAYIPWEQTGQNPINSTALDLYDGVYPLDPRLNQYANPLPEIKIINEGILIGGSEIPKQVWLNYRPLAPEFTLEAWKPDLTYAVGDLVHSLETYICLVANSNKAPNSNPTEWALVEFPAFLKNYVKFGVRGDYLNDDDPAAGKSYGLATREIERLGSVIVEQTAAGRKGRFQVAR